MIEKTGVGVARTKTGISGTVIPVACTSLVLNLHFRYDLFVSPLSACSFCKMNRLSLPTSASDSSSKGAPKGVFLQVHELHAISVQSFYLRAAEVNLAALANVEAVTSVDRKL